MITRTIQVSHSTLSSFLHNTHWVLSNLREGLEGEDDEGEGEQAITKQFSLQARRIGYDIFVLQLDALVHPLLLCRAQPQFRW